MALVVIRKPEYFLQSGLGGLWFDVTVMNTTISVLHSGDMWSGYGNTPFSLRAGATERSSFEEGGMHQCVFFSLGAIGEITLLIGDVQVLLKDLYSKISKRGELSWIVLGRCL